MPISGFTLFFIQQILNFIKKDAKFYYHSYYNDACHPENNYFLKDSVIFHDILINPSFFKGIIAQNHQNIEHKTHNNIHKGEDEYNFEFEELPAAYNSRDDEYSTNCQQKDLRLIELQTIRVD